MCTLMAGLVFGFGPAVSAQTDPGPRAGPSDAGGPFEKLNDDEQRFFWAAWERFKEVASVSGTIQSERGFGLGPTFNGNSCAACHAQPAAGGSSPSSRSPQVRQLALQGGRLVLAPQGNPQVALAQLDRIPGHEQAVPSFITADGPVRVPHFITKPNGTADGTVHDIFTIAGRMDAPGCILPQPDFEREIAKNNVIFRIPTPAFGAGLIEAVSDDGLVANLDSTAKQRQALGIAGRFNRTVNDGTISRFGWKAQIKSLLLFAAESSNVEEGVTNEVFPEERDHTPGCLFNPLPEDRTKLKSPPGIAYEPSGLSSDIVNFAAFMRLLAPPKPAALGSSGQNGSVLFESVGCAICHSPTLKAGPSSITGMSNVEIHPYSDFALHHMGRGLADHICQGLASGDEFRSAPLWGLGQRIFFLHDGRTSDLLAAVEDHTDTHLQRQSRFLFACGNEARRSEADEVIRRFNALLPSQKQDLMDFLRSL
jgi:CxxC motif-containing protein (DUF1111 family)